MLSKVLVLTTLALFVAGTAGADVICHDGFADPPYKAGSGAGYLDTFLNGGTGWSDDHWATAGGGMQFEELVDPGMTYTGMATTGLYVRTRNREGLRAFRAADLGAEGDVFWLACLASVTKNDLARMVQVRDASNSAVLEFEAEEAADYTWHVKIPGDGSTVDVDTGADIGNVTLLLTRPEYGAGTVTVTAWVGDALDLGDGSADEPVSAPIDLNGADPGSSVEVSAFGIARWFFDNNKKASSYINVDEFRITQVGDGQTSGEAYQELLTIPEPCTLMVLGLGGLGLLIPRRRC